MLMLTGHCPREGREKPSLCRRLCLAILPAAQGHWASAAPWVWSDRAPAGSVHGACPRSEPAEPRPRQTDVGRRRAGEGGAPSVRPPIPELTGASAFSCSHREGGPAVVSSCSSLGDVGGGVGLVLVTQVSRCPGWGHVEGPLGAAPPQARPGHLCPWQADSDPKQLGGVGMGAGDSLCDISEDHPARRGWCQPCLPRREGGTGDKGGFGAPPSCRCEKSPLPRDGLGGVRGGTQLPLGWQRSSWPQP